MIGNIAVETTLRNVSLNYGVLHPLVDVLKEALVKKDYKLIEQGTRALSNICSAEPLPVYERIADATPILCTIIQEATDIVVLKDAVWPLGYLSDTEEKVTKLLESDVVPSLMRCLEYNKQGL